MRDRLAEAQALRLQADRLEREHNRPIPEKWKIGMRVRYLRSKEWAWDEGDEGVVIQMSRDRKVKGCDYQVFYTRPTGSSSESRYWTTPDDVEWIPEAEGMEVGR